MTTTIATVVTIAADSRNNNALYNDDVAALGDSQSELDTTIV